MSRILCICTGNICRSPMAEVLLQRRLGQEGLTDWQVESAGTWAVDGHPASRHAVQVMADQGLDLMPHRSRAVTRRIIQGVDLVLAMTHNHVEALRLEFPDQAANIYLLSEIPHYPFIFIDPHTVKYIYGPGFIDHAQSVDYRIPDQQIIH